MGRKSRLRRSRSKREARRPRIREEASTADRLIELARQAGIVNREELILMPRPRSLSKLSDRILVLLDPLRYALRTDGDFAKLAACAVTAWNMAILSGDELPEPANFDKKAWADTKPILEYLMDRKRMLFPHDQRLILSHELSGQGDRQRLDVLYELPSADDDR